MSFRGASVWTLQLVVLLALTACARDASPTAADDAADEDTSADAPAVADAAVPTPAPSAAAASDGKTAPKGPAQESLEAVTGADDDVLPNKSERTLERLTQLPKQDQLPAGKWQVGKNYQTIVPAQPTSVGPGRVEIVEMFWYGCGHCYELDPFLESWKKNKAAYIDFVRVPVTWGPVHRSHARLFYTLQALGQGDALHTKVFDAIHRGGKTLVGNDEDSTFKEQMAWAKSNGITEQKFKDAYNSFGVNSAMQRAEQLTRRYRVEGVPMLVVNGKYSTDVGSAGGQSQLLALLNDLAVSEKRR